MIIPTNVGQVSRAIQAMLNDHPSIGNEGVTIERSVEPPDDPGCEGYIGIYKGRCSLPIRTLGMGSGFRDHNLRFCLSVRMSGYEDGEECETALEDLLQHTVSCLLSDTSLRGTVENIGVFEVEYDTVVINEKEKEYLQVANVFFEALSIVTVTED